MVYNLPDDPFGMDTVQRDEVCMLVNQITQEYFDVHLCTCPNCGSIIPFYNGSEKESCNSCLMFHDDPISKYDCPDLFF